MTHNVPEKSSTKRDPDVNATDGETQTPKSYQNKSCSECQQDVRKSERHVERQTDRQTDRKTEPLFSLGVKTKVVLNVNRMSER